MTDPPAGSSGRVVYGPPRPPEMLESERQAAQQSTGEASHSTGNLRICGYEHEIDPFNIRDEDVEAMRAIGFEPRYEIYDEEGNVYEEPAIHGIGGGLPRAQMPLEEPWDSDPLPRADENDDEDDDDDNDDPDYQTANSEPTHDSEDGGPLDDAEENESPDEDDSNAESSHDEDEGIPTITMTPANCELPSVRPDLYRC